MRAGGFREASLRGSGAGGRRVGVMRVDGGGRVVWSNFRAGGGSGSRLG